MKLVVYIADKRLNDFMAQFGTCPDYKVFVQPVVQEVTRQSTDSDEDFAGRLIEKSKTDSENSFWVPAVSCDGVLYSDPSIKEISDGRKSMFLGG